MPGQDGKFNDESDLRVWPRRLRGADCKILQWPDCTLQGAS